MLSAKTGLLRANILKNKSIKSFYKTMSSKLFHHSTKNYNDFTNTKSTKFSEDNLTNTINSSKYRLSKNKENPLFIGLEDFHKKFILSKNTNMNLKTINNFSHDKIHKVISLKKHLGTPLILPSASDSKSNIIPFINSNSIKQKNKEQKRNTVSFTSSYFGNDDIIQKNEDNKLIQNFELDKSKSKIFNSDNKNINHNIISLKNYNIFNIYNKNITNVNNNYLNSEFSLSKEIERKKNINNNNKINNNENKNDKIKLFYGRNKLKLMDKFAYPNYHYSVRIETNQEFYYKTKINIFNNYRKYLNNNSYLKLKLKKNFEEEKELIQERNVELFEKLFSIYEKALDDYLQFLQKKIIELEDKKEYLVKDRYEIQRDIEKIKMNILKGMSKIRDGFSIKYFLTCVKNHTLSQEKFRPEDLLEIEHDRQKLNESYYLLNKERKQKRKTYRKQSIANIFMNNSQLRRIQEHFLTKRVNRNSERKSTIANQINKSLSKKNTKDTISLTIPKRFKVQSTIQEFFESLDFISSKVYNLILEYNNNYYKTISLKFELENIKKKSSDTIYYSDYLQGQITICEDTLKELKSKNKKLLSNLSKLKALQFQRNVKFLLVLNNIHLIYSNIKRIDNKIITITKEMVISYGERYYLTIIEKFFFKLLLKVNDLKKRNLISYKVIKDKLDREKIKNVFYNYQRLLAEKIQIKVDTVLKKADKIIYKPYRKTNDYKKEHKKHKVTKKEIKKSNLELFKEYLDDSD